METLLFIYCLGVIVSFLFGLHISLIDLVKYKEFDLFKSLLFYGLTLASWLGALLYISFWISYYVDIYRNNKADKEYI